MAAVIRPSSLTSLDLICFQSIVFKLNSLLAIFLILVSQCLAGDGYDTQMEEFLKREYSLNKPYQGLGSSSSSHWDLMGNAMITPEHVRLTPDMQSRQGAVWSRIPFHLRDWELQIHFKIHGVGKKNLNGDGMAVWYTKERMRTGPVFGNMNLFTGLGLFVDTYPNEEKSAEKVFPYVSVMVGNGTHVYDHDLDGQPTQLGGCSAPVRNVNHDTFILIRYMHHRLTVMIDVEGKREWRNCLDVSGVRLPRGYYFGASAVTGDLSDNHDLISLKLYQLTVYRNTEEEEEEEEITVPSVDHLQQLIVDVQNEGMSGMRLFFTILLSGLGCIVLGVIAVVLYGHWKENSRKRFY